ncbi:MULTISPECIES: YkuJ family protein [unclassified Enterococcus]|uniref:YkuJ family protein n=1 Tax=unclassified Enterococcus TaxID=2608891 RepID=UPI0015579BFB|nr:MULTISPECIES: YkuJ family protein [unclassified Enterococcus]MBS7576381.1 YkuJ family protein [Enterococcus sp. MMGLQ5-2]MBS7583613.1 YkuJ family protein [Enterococcus sp. MMGLQ5-1]NPD11474.1 YkuJ family protein [Enterococcus sp. MMGLQ5-1]NPD36218.1 YkuJ family protein [Enterococcus sp. MMGLQ5-2]
MKSRLVAIIKRLEAMLEAKDGEDQIRRFERDGEVKAEVAYSQESEAFTLTDVDSNQTYTFDDIDMVAIEIYELIY